VNGAALGDTGREIVNSRDITLYQAVLALQRDQSGQCCEAFTLTVVNNTGRPEKIFWDRTFYVHNGTQEGGFLFLLFTVIDCNICSTL